MHRIKKMWEEVPNRRKDKKYKRLGGSIKIPLSVLAGWMVGSAVNLGLIMLGQDQSQSISDS